MHMQPCTLMYMVDGMGMNVVYTSHTVLIIATAFPQFIYLYANLIYNIGGTCIPAMFIDIKHAIILHSCSGFPPKTLTLIKLSITISQ